MLACISLASKGRWPKRGAGTIHVGDASERTRDSNEASLFQVAKRIASVASSQHCHSPMKQSVRPLSLCTFIALPLVVTFVSIKLPQAYRCCRFLMVTWWCKLNQQKSNCKAFMCTLFVTRGNTLVGTIDFLYSYQVLGVQLIFFVKLVNFMNDNRTGSVAVS